jgi:hypothetical protein
LDPGISEDLPPAWEVTIVNQFTDYEFQKIPSVSYLTFEISQSTEVYCIDAVIVWQTMALSPPKHGFSDPPGELV